MTPQQAPISAADVGFAIWPDSDDDDGLELIVVKGGHLLRDALLEGEVPVSLLPCVDRDQAKVLAYMLSGRPLDGREHSGYSVPPRSRPAATTVSSEQRNQSWNATPQRKLLKLIVVAIHQSGLRGVALVAKFKELAPDYQSFFDRPLSDQSITQRGDRASRYPNENPATNPKLKAYWPLAQSLVEDDNPDMVREALEDPDEMVREHAS